MNLKVRYLISEKWKQADIHEAIDAITFSIKYYNIQNPKATLTVKLINIDTDEGTADKLKSNRYEIRITRSPNFLTSIFHEMTHVKQFVQDGFNFNKRLFRGENYEGVEYYFTPWEMEARAMEQPLATAYEEEYK